MADHLDILSMSDEEFSKLPSPPAVEEDKEKLEETPESDEVQDNTQAEPKPEDKVEDKPASTPEAEKPEDKPVPEDKEETPKPEDKPAPEKETKPEPQPEKPSDKPEAGTEPAPKDDEPKPEPKPEPKSNIDFEGFYKQVMAPFKANGKVIQLQSADEVISLMQMGANYTKKMQAIQQSKKFLIMLENNGLLDENKLSFLIDLDKKNPEAIKKFLKDSKIDPVDLDTSGETNYKSGSHAVSDQEAALSSAIDDLNSTPEGKATLQSVQSWDPASKKALYDNPSILAAIHTHHSNGFYQKIVDEMERRRVIGQVDPSAPFLITYKAIGDELNAKGVFVNIAKPAAAPTQPAARAPVAVRPAKTPAAKAADAAKVRAAAPPRSAAPARMDINVLALSDEEFMKKFPNGF